MTDHATVWASIEASLAGMTTKQLHKLVRKSRRELCVRHQAHEALKERLAGAMQGMANVMAGVTWALACRAALRQSKGHPPLGKRAASGEMWLPRELLTCVRHQVRDRGWHPITTTDWSTFRAHWEGEQAKRPLKPGDSLFPAMSTVQFAVRMAAPTYARLDINRRFDLGGEG